MLTFKNSLLKIFCLFLCFLFTPITKADHRRYAKVVLLGKIGSGKTTLHTILQSNSGFVANQGSLEDILHPVHTTNLSVQTRTSFKEYGNGVTIDDLGIGRYHPLQLQDLNIDLHFDDNDYNRGQINCYFYDTSAEEFHENTVDEFCNNAHAIFLCVKAEDFIYRQNGKLYFQESEDFYKLLRKIPKIAPKSKVIIFLTQIENVEGASNGLKNQIKNFIENIKNQDGFKDYVHNSFNFQLDYSDPITQKIFQYHAGIFYNMPSNKYIKEFIGTFYPTYSTDTVDKFKCNPGLYGLLSSLISRHGFDYFPKTPKGFSATIEEKKYVETETVDNNDCTGSKSTRTRTKNEYKLKVLKNADEDKD